MRIKVRALAFGVVVAASSIASAEEQAVRLYAAGSLRGAMTEVALTLGPPEAVNACATSVIAPRRLPAA